MCVAAAGPLASARWTWRAPRVAVVVWQFLLAALLLSAVGLPLSVALGPYRAPVPVALRRAAVDLADGRLVATLGMRRVALLAVALGLAACAAGAVGVGYQRSVRVRR